RSREDGQRRSDEGEGPGDQGETDGGPERLEPEERAGRGGSCHGVGLPTASPIRRAASPSVRSRRRTGFSPSAPNRSRSVAVVASSRPTPSRPASADPTTTKTRRTERPRAISSTSSRYPARASPSAPAGAGSAGTNGRAWIGASDANRAKPPSMPLSSSRNSSNRRASSAEGR